MDKSRSISTKTWTDSYFENRDPIEKLLWVYLLTNPATNLAGIYELNVSRMSFETGIDKDMVSKILARYESDGKLIYREGWILLVNFPKYQKYNPSMATHVRRLLRELPSHILEITEFKPYIEALHTLCKACTQPVHTLGGNIKSKKENNKTKNKKTKIEKKPSEDFAPPSLNEVELYFEQNGFSKDLAARAYNHYHPEWIDARGNRVLNWKQKMRTVWFKTESTKTNKNGKEIRYDPLGRVINLRDLWPEKGNI